MRQILVKLAIVQSSLFCSHLALAAPSAAGNEGGGGGSVVECPGQELKLTDLYEAETRDASLVSYFARLRELSETQALEFVSERLVEFLSLSDAGSPPTLSEIRNLMRGNYYNLNFGDPADPKDSGDLTIGARCSEQRVAVNSNYDIYKSEVKPEFTRNYVVVVKALWYRMKPFDRYALLMHEILYAITEGRISIDDMDPLLKREKNSADIRRLVALVLTGRAKQFALPLDGKRLDCWAGTAAVRRKESQWDRIHFDIRPLSNSATSFKSEIRITSAWGVPVFIPNAAGSYLDVSAVGLRGSMLVPVRGTGVASIPNPISQLNMATKKIELTKTEVSFRVDRDTTFDGAKNFSPSREQVMFMKVERVAIDSQREVLLDGPINCNPF